MVVSSVELKVGLRVRDYFFKPGLGKTRAFVGTSPGFFGLGLKNGTECKIRSAHQHKSL